MLTLEGIVFTLTATFIAGHELLAVLAINMTIGRYFAARTQEPATLAAVSESRPDEDAMTKGFTDNRRRFWNGGSDDSYWVL